MCKSKDLNELKNAKIINIATSKGIDLSSKAPNARITQVLVDFKHVNDETINRYMAHYNNRFSHQTVYIYATLTFINLAQLLVIKFDSIAIIDVMIGVIYSI
jgi:hypothetical protein